MTATLPEVDVFAGLDITPACEVKTWDRPTECGAPADYLLTVHAADDHKPADRYSCEGCLAHMRAMRIVQCSCGIIGPVEPLFILEVRPIRG